MSLALIFPAGLIALTALLLPLLIHLARRSEHRLSEFSALRWLQALPRPRQRLRVEQWPLLSLRLLLLASLALLLAQPVLVGYGRAQAHIAVVPGVDTAQLRASELPPSARRVWLAEGFPALDSAMPATRQAGASLLRELDALLPAAADLTVIVPQHWDGADAQRLQLSRQVHWQVVPGSSPQSASAPRAMPRLQVYADTIEDPALHYLRALQWAWSGRDLAAPLAAATGSVPPAGSVAVWLSRDPLPALLQQWLQQGGQLLVDSRAPLPTALRLSPVWRDAHGNVLLQAAALGNGRVLRFSRELAPAALPQLLEATFAEQLRTHLQAPPAPRLVAAVDYRPQQLPQRWAQPVQALAPWLLIWIALLFVLERIVASAVQRRSMA
jgi:hypothetical protein